MITSTLQIVLNVYVLSQNYIDFIWRNYLQNHPWENQDFWCLFYRLDLSSQDHIYTWFHWYNSRVRYTSLHIGDRYKHYQWPMSLAESQQDKILGTIWNAQIWKRDTSPSKSNQHINVSKHIWSMSSGQLLPLHHTQEVQNMVQHFRTINSIPQTPGFCQ